MPRRRTHALLAVLLASSACVACRYRPGHPVLRGPWGSGAPHGAVAGAPSLPAGDPSEVEQGTPARIDEFFGDLGQLRLRLREMRARATALDQPVARFSDRTAAVGLLRRTGGRGPLGGTVRNVVVYGISGELPVSARQAGGLWLDARAQGKALGVSSFALEGKAFDLDEAVRLAYRVEMLHVGTAPMTFDLIFGTWVEALELPDGTVLLRYDPRPTAGQQHVTHWRGGAIFEPSATGCVVTEVVLFGTDIRLPLFESLLRGQVEDALMARGINLAGFAYQLAGRTAPRPR